MNKISQSKNSLDILVFLRAVAVLMVCFCHFGAALEEGHYLSELFSCFGVYGKYGVYVFFVISGFVIPLSLFRGKYILSYYSKFLFKRVVRLHPPYLAALLLTLVVSFLSYKVRHVEFPENGFTIFKSLFYMHIPADNPVFWTLMVEAQYYIFIGFFFISIIKFPKLSLILFIPLLLVISQTYLANYISLLQYIVFFLVGTIGFLLYTQIGDFYLNWIVLLLLFTFIFFYNDIPSLLASSFTVLLILFSDFKISTGSKFLGLISYSVYLIHFPIGIKFINYFRPKIDPSYSWLLFLTTLVLSIILAWFFYLIFESYCEKLSKKIYYDEGKILDKVKI